MAGGGGVIAVATVVQLQYYLVQSLQNANIKLFHLHLKKTIADRKLKIR